MEKVNVTLNGYDKDMTYQLFLRVNDENGITTGYTCKSYDEYTRFTRITSSNAIFVIDS